jgi:hypothetical protein
MLVEPEACLIITRSKSDLLFSQILIACIQQDLLSALKSIPSDELDQVCFSPPTPTLLG